MGIRLDQEGFTIGPRIGEFLWVSSAAAPPSRHEHNTHRGDVCNLLEKNLQKSLAHPQWRFVSHCLDSIRVMLTAGRRAPDFSLVNQNDEQQDLAALRGHPVLVYFYPRPDTPDCTQQACGLRDIAGQVATTVTLGINPDKPPALARFPDH